MGIKPSTRGEGLHPVRGATTIQQLISSSVFGVGLPWLVATLLLPVGLTFIVYWPYLNDFFVDDDFMFLQQVHNHGALDAFVRAFTSPHATEFEAPTPLWRPATDVLIQTQHALWGLRPGPYHAMSFTMHGLIGGLGGVLVSKLSRSAVAGLVTASVFVVFPSYDVAVTWISDQTELFPALLSMVSLVAFYGFLMAEEQRSAKWALAGSIVALQIAMLGKESQAVSGILLALLAFTVTNPRRTRREIAVALAVAFVAVLPIGLFGYVQELRDPASSRLYGLGAHTWSNSWEHLGQLTFPFGSPGKDGPTEARDAAAVVYLSLGIGAMLMRWRVPTFFFVWSLIALAVFGPIRFPPFARYTYLATLPFVAFCVTGARASWRRVLETERSRFALALVGAAIVAFVVLGSALETRRRQAPLHRRAQDFEAVVAATRIQCGELARDIHVYVLGRDPADPFNVNMAAALNLFHERVYVGRGDPPARAGRFCLVEVPPSSE